MADNQNTGANSGLNLNQQSSNLQNLRQGLKDLLDDQGDYNNLLKSSLTDLEKTATQYKKIEDRLSSLSKESINVKEINQELYKLRQKESDEQKKLTQLQSLYGKQTVSVLENAKKRALEDKKLYESQGSSFDLEKQILNNLQEQGNLEAVKIFTQQKQLDFAKQKTKEGQLALDNEKNLAKQLGLTGNSADILAKKLSVGKEAYATMVADARKLLEGQKTISQLPQQKVLNSPQQSQTPVQVQQTIGQAQAQAQAQQAQAQAQQTIGQAQAQAQAQQSQTPAQAQTQQAPLNNTQPVQPVNLNIKKEELDISKSLEQSIRDSRRLQGDNNSELNKSINLLSQINDLRDQSISKVKALNKESINTKDIQRELKKVKEKDELAIIKASKLESSLNDIQKQNATDYIAAISARSQKEQQIERARLQGNAQLARFLGAQLNQIDQIIGSQEQNLSVDERRYAAAIQATKVSKETKSLLEDELSIEKEIQKSVGFTGIGLSKISEKLGLGTKYYEELVEKARELEDEGKKLTFGDKLKALKDTGKDAIKETFTDPLTAIPAVAGMAVGAYKLVESGLTAVGNAAAKAGNFMAGMTEDSSNIVRGLTSGISDLARKIPLIGGALGGLIDGFSAILDLVIGVDDKIIKAGRDLNLGTNEARALNREFQTLSFNSGNIFTNSKKLLQSQVELSNQLGVVNRFTNQQLETNIMLKDIAGLELDTRQQILETSIISGKSSDNVVKSVLAQVKGLKNATGIQFQNKQILKEVASQSGYIGLQFTKYPAQLTKSLLTVKAMGLELKDLDSMASSFLDFESSISKEFEAQLLTGKNINLTKAREAFLNNDLAAAAAEITSQIGTSEDFLKLNRIQAESLADAFGMSRDQLGEMLKRQELLSKLGAKDTDTAREQLKLGLQKYQSEKALAEAIGEQAYQNLVNASTQEKIAVFMEKIKQSIVDFVENSGIIEKVQGFIDYISKPENIRAILTQVRDTFADIAYYTLEVVNGVINAIDFLTLGFGIDEKFERDFEKLTDNIPKKIKAFGGNLNVEPKKEIVKPETVSNATTTPIDKTFRKPTKETVKPIQDTANTVAVTDISKRPVQETVKPIKTAEEKIKPTDAKKDVASLEDRKVKNEVQIITVNKEPNNREMPMPVSNKDMVINLHYHNADEINTFSTKLGKGISIDTQFGHSGYTVANNNAI